jgi:pimeloyl-ACP methyl ester carboxylesterase
MAKAHLNGIDIAYESYGDGFPIVLAHGLAATKESWDGQIGPFMERYRVVVYDARGHGESDSPPVDDAGYTMDQLVDDQKALMDHLGIEQAYIGGLSLGGMIAMRFALKYPQATRALMLFDTSPGMGTQGMWSSNRAVMEPLVRAQGVAGIMRGLYSQGAKTAGLKVQAASVPQPVLDFLKHQQSLTPDGFLGISRAAGDAPSVLERIHEITAPTLIVTGDTDFFRDASVEMKRRLTGARFVLITGAWHGTNIWQPEKFTTTVLDFLADAEAGNPVAAEITL